MLLAIERRRAWFIAALLVLAWIGLLRIQRPVHANEPVSAPLSDEFVPPPFPVLFIDRPASYPPPYVHLDSWLSPIQPEYSVLVNVYNRERTLHLILVQLLKHTKGPWELIVAIDGSTDRSLDVVDQVWKRWQSWPQCNHNVTDTQIVWQSGARPNENQGDIGLECHTGDVSLVHIAVYVIPPPGVFATAADNLKMRHAAGTFFILVDDDQLMTTPGWNVRLVYPLRAWPDVFSVSGRCAHGFRDGREADPYVGPKCRDSRAPQPAEVGTRCTFFVRDSGNRGPLALRATMVRRLDYLDEANFLGVITTSCDHDLNVRAYTRFGWVSGFLALDYTEERKFRSHAGNEADVQRYIAWWRDRPRIPSVHPTAFHGEHNENRRINDTDFDPQCVLV